MSLNRSHKRTAFRKCVYVCACEPSWLMDLETEGRTHVRTPKSGSRNTKFRVMLGQGSGPSPEARYNGVQP